MIGYFAICHLVSVINVKFCFYGKRLDKYSEATQHITVKKKTYLE